MDEAHSSVVGGSTAARRLACPASYQLEQKVPLAARNTSSEYADEGTALHECMAYILTENVTDLDSVLGMTFGVSETSPAGWVVTQELMDTCIAPAVDFFDALCDELEEEGGFDFVVEQKVEFPGIPNAFGTADILGRTLKRSISLDWKFGTRPVKASYPDSEHPKGRRINAQGGYYSRAGAHSLPHLFEKNPDWPVDIYIFQPRPRDGGETYSHVSTDMRELEEFRMELVSAVSEAINAKDPHIEIGSHCDFASCRSVCPLHLGPKLDLTKMQGALKARRENKEVKPLDWSREFSWLLDACNLAEAAIGEIRTQAHAFLEQGGRIVGEDGKPAWKLVDKRPTYKYTDEDGAKRHALGLGLEPEDVFEPQTLKSPAQLRDTIAEKVMEGKTKKDRQAAAVESLAPFAHSASSGTTLAPAGDRRTDAVVTATQLNAIGAKIAALTGR